MTNSHLEVSKKRRLLTYGIYTKLIEGIKNYDNMQSIFRRIASTFLLAAFAAIGFLLSIDRSAFSLNPSYCVLFVSALSIIGITVIGFLDLIFQERIVVGYFVELLKLEKENDWLPQIHHNMILHGSHHGSPVKKSIFYISCCSSVIFISGLISLLIIKFRNWYLILIVSFFSAFLIIAYAYFFSKATGRFEKLAKILMEKPKNV